jgi:hypothetical protein
MVTPAAFVELGINALKRRSTPNKNFFPAAQIGKFLISRAGKYQINFSGAIEN